MKRLFELVNRNVILSKLKAVFTSRIRRSKSLPLISISREMGSGGRPVAYLVEHKLGRPWKVYHSEIVEEIAKQSRLEKKLIKEVDERNIPFIDEAIYGFFGRRYMNLSNYYKHLVRVLSTIGHRGYAIIIGRGAEYLFPNSLNIKLIGDFDQRVKWVSSYEHISKGEAEERIRDSDRKRVNFVKTLYYKDYNDPHYYDLVIKTGPEISIEQASNIIVNEVRRRFRL